MPAHARGDVGILKVLVVATSDTMVEQHYGCLCGSINGELQEALQRALQGAEPSDQLVVKTTGRADPMPVALTFQASDLRDPLRLDSISRTDDHHRHGHPHHHHAHSPGPEGCGGAMNRIHLLSGAPNCGKTSCILTNRPMDRKPFHERAGDQLFSSTFLQLLFLGYD